MIARRHALLALPCLALPSLARADEQDQQIALDSAGEYILTETTDEAHRRNDVVPPHFTGARPNYPEKAWENGVEGLVVMSATVLKDGTGRDFQVLESYPGRIFDKHVIGWTPRFSFVPATINGEAREARGHRFAFSFYRNDARGLSLETIGHFRKLGQALTDGQVNAMEAELSVLEKRRDRGLFNLTELARFSEMAARVATAKKKFIEANEHNAQAIFLGQFLDADVVLESAYRLRVVLFIQLAKFDQAVDTFDAFKKVFTRPEPQLAPVIAMLREKGFGKGVSYPIKSKVISGI